MVNHRIKRILAVLALLILTFAFASCALSESEKHIAVESSVLVAGKEATTVTIVLDSTDFDINLTDESIAKLEVNTEDGFTYKLTPLAEGTTQIVVNYGEATYTKDIKIYATTLSLGLQSLIIGLGTVFAALIVLWIILIIFGKVGGATKTKQASKIESTPVSSDASAVSESTNESAENEEEIVAAIVGAISAYTGNDASSFKVVSFKRKTTIKSWNHD